MKRNTQQLNNMVVQVRRDILRMVHAVNSGHPGGSLGCAEFFVALYQNLMDRKETFNMDGIGEDIFFLSNGHIAGFLQRTGAKRVFPCKGTCDIPPHRFPPARPSNDA
jgi:transketolase